MSRTYDHINTYSVHVVGYLGDACIGMDFIMNLAHEYCHSVIMFCHCSVWDGEPSSYVCSSVTPMCGYVFFLFNCPRVRTPPLVQHDA